MKRLTSSTPGGRRRAGGPARWSLAACGSSGSSSSPSGSSSSARADGIGARHHANDDHDRQPPAAHRHRGARLRRDRPGVQRLFPVRQRARRHLRPQDHLQVPERPVQPDSITTTVVHQLVLQDNVYAIFNGLGTPTHLAVAPYLNAQKVPDLFVASGCECWNAPSTLPDTFGWQPNYIREGKILGSYVASALQGQEDRLLLPERRVRPGRRQGPRLRDPEVPGRRQGALQPGQHQHRPAGGRAEGGRGPGRGLVLGPGLHRAAELYSAEARASTRSS